MALTRAFFCVPLPEPLLNDISRWIREAAGSQPQARWVTRDNLHVTLRFCGEIPERTVSALGARLSVSLREALGDTPELTIGRTGSFGRPPRVFWAGLGGETEKLRALNAIVERACRDEGLVPESRRFSPHLTLACVPIFSKTRLDLLPPWTLEGRAWRTERVIFMRSVLTPGGARYSPLFVYESERRARSR